MRRPRGDGVGPSDCIPSRDGSVAQATPLLLPKQQRAPAPAGILEASESLPAHVDETVVAEVAQVASFDPSLHLDTAARDGPPAAWPIGPRHCPPHKR